MSDFGAPRNPVTFGGRGEFDGTMTGPFRSPRVEGEFSGEDLRGFDTLWGGGDAHIVVENDYVRVTDGVVALKDSEMHFDGLFSLGFPRDDGGDEIDARIRVVRRDVDSLRHAFGIDDYPVSGSAVGRVPSHRRLSAPGRLRRHDARAPRRLRRAASERRPRRCDSTAAGVRLDGLNVEKDGGIDHRRRVRRVGRDLFVQRRRPAHSGREHRAAPFSEGAAVRASPSSRRTAARTFDAPRNDYRFRVNDLFIGEEGVGQVTATLALRGTELSGEIDAASPRLAVTATGHVAMTPQGESEFAVRFHDMSLDPYVRPFVPRLSPFATAVASGSIRVVGPPGRRRSPARRRHGRHARHAAVRLRAQERDADSDVARQRAGEDRRAAARRRGHAPPARRARRSAQRADRACRPTATPISGILQGFFHDVRGSGRADLTAAVDGPLREPVFSGRATITNGRVRHFSLPSSLDAINGVLSFDRAGFSSTS